jgi:hypothetical protein
MSFFPLFGREGFGFESIESIISRFFTVRSKSYAASVANSVKVANYDT